MKDEATRLREGMRWLTVVLAVIALVPLVLLYLLWQPSADNRFGHLVIQMIPNALAVLVGVPIVYFIFTRKGLGSPTLIDTERLADLVAQRVASSNGGPSQLLAFHDTFRHVNWSELLSSANATVDIVVYYFDSWVNANYDSLRAYFSKPGSRMRVFVSDPRDDAIVENVTRLFPEYTPQVVRDKIARTGDRLLQALRESGGDPERLEFYYVPHHLNYSAQCLDERTLVLSIYEMFRKSRIDSPAIVLDLTRSDHMARYWHKERAGLLQVSERVALGSRGNE